MEILPIAKIKNSFKEKFGIPRQSGICNVLSYIVFEKEYNVKEAFRGLEEYSHIWLIWEFSEFSDKKWSPTVRPPRLGGNKRIGVFATRSPNRPNSLGLSSVKLLRIIEDSSFGTVLEVSGADLMDETPIYDIKPYVKYSDSHPDSTCSFSDDFSDYKIQVSVCDEVLSSYPKNIIDEIVSILSLDPKPSYQKDLTRIYGMSYGDYNVKFQYTAEGILLLKIAKINC